MKVGHTLGTLSAVVIYTAGMGVYAVTNPAADSFRNVPVPTATVTSTTPAALGVHEPLRPENESIPVLAGSLAGTQRTTARKLTILGGHLNEYWSAQFAAKLFGERAWKPVRKLFVDIESRNCPGATEMSFHDYYCPAQHYVELALAPLDVEGAVRTLPDRHFIIAHEWGHAAQSNAGIDMNDKHMELQADCFAGAFLRYAYDRHILASAEIDLVRVRSSIAEFGDDRIAPMAGMEHGTGPERVEWFDKGWNAGLASCLSPL